MSQKDEKQRVVPVTEEDLKIEKKRQPTGGVRVKKSVHERQETINEPLIEETVEVKRVAIDEFVDEARETREHDGTTIIPVHEEVLVIEKKLRLKEEIHVTRHRVTHEQPQSVTLRREEATVTPTDESKGSEQSPTTTRSS